MINQNSISSYESYQTHVSKFWSNVNSVKECLKYSQNDDLRKNIRHISKNINNISKFIPILEKGACYRRENDGIINFREIFFLVLEETKQKIGTATIDQENITFQYPN